MQALDVQALVDASGPAPTAGFDDNDVAIVDSALAAAKAGALSNQPKDQKAIAHRAAMKLIFGVFDRKNGGGGEWVGSAVKMALKTGNGGKPVKGRSVTETMIRAIDTKELLRCLETHRDARAASIADREVYMRSHNFTELDIGTYVANATQESQDNFQAAQEWINRAWGAVPSAMKVIRAAGNGRVRTTDGGDDVAVDLAFERVVCNRALTAKAFAKAVMGK